MNNLLNKKQLYNNIMKNISNIVKQKLNEDLLSDLEDDDDDDSEYMGGDLLNDKFKKVIIDTLCKSGNYYNVIENDPDFPYILKNPDNPNQYFLAPYRSYTTCNFGPRKRKQYTKLYFYRYILDFYSESGKPILHVAKTTGNDNLIINQQLYDFIEQCPQQLESIIYYYPENTYHEYTDGFNTIWLTIGKSRYSKTISDKFVKNFPNRIIPGETEDYIGDMNPNGRGTTLISRSWFSSDEMFMIFVEKLTNSNFNISDDDSFVYNRKTIEERKSALLSGKQDQQLEEEKEENSKKIIDLIGYNYYEKFNKIKDYFDSENQILYLNNINTLRGENKINCLNTVQNLRKDNGYIYDEIDTIDDAYSRNQHVYNKWLIYKMLTILTDEKLNDWKNKYDYDDCLHGVPSMYGYGSSEVEINKLPIKLTGINSLYKLYYVIGKSIVCGDKCKLANLIKDGTYDNTIATNIEKTDTVFNIDDFDFHYLTNQLRFIIDKTVKKYKLK